MCGRSDYLLILIQLRLGETIHVLPVKVWQKANRIMKSVMFVCFLDIYLHTPIAMHLRMENFSSVIQCQKGYIIANSSK